MDDEINSFQLNLSSMPDFVLIKIFSYCSIQDLGRIAQVCSLFQCTLESHVWICRSKNVIGSNMARKQMKLRAQPALVPSKRVKISRLWARNTVLPSCKVYKYDRCMPFMQLNSSYLYLSSREHIMRYSRKPDCVASRDVRYVITPHNDDVSKFIVCESRIVSAGRDGTVTFWPISKVENTYTFQAHTRDILGLDCQDDFAVSCSQDKTVKLFQLGENSTTGRLSISFNIRVLDVAFLFSSRWILCSTPGVNNIQPLELYDSVACKKVTHFGDGNHRNGAGILCIYPESKQTFLSCGYDTTIRLWDVRTPKQHVSSWMDIYDNSIYCVTSDHNVTIVSGAGQTGLVHVWDKRSRHPVKMLHGRNSPVYSVAFDPCNIFAALDCQVHHYSFL